MLIESMHQFAYSKRSTIRLLLLLLLLLILIILLLLDLIVIALLRASAMDIKVIFTTTTTTTITMTNITIPLIQRMYVLLHSITCYVMIRLVSLSLEQTSGGGSLESVGLIVRSLERFSLLLLWIYR